MRRPPEITHGTSCACPHGITPGRRFIIFMIQRGGVKVKPLRETRADSGLSAPVTHSRVPGRHVWLPRPHLSFSPRGPEFLPEGGWAGEAPLGYPRLTLKMGEFYIPVPPASSSPSILPPGATSSLPVVAPTMSMNRYYSQVHAGETKTQCLSPGTAN